MHAVRIQAPPLLRARLVLHCIPCTKTYLGRFMPRSSSTSRPATRMVRPMFCKCDLHRKLHVHPCLARTSLHHREAIDHVSHNPSSKQHFAHGLHRCTVVYTSCNWSITGVGRMTCMPASTLNLADRDQSPLSLRIGTSKDNGSALKQRNNDVVSTFRFPAYLTLPSLCTTNLPPWHCFVHHPTPIPCTCQ